MPGRKKTKGGSPGLRSPEVVWALNLLWIGLGNYYGSGFEKPLWVLVGLFLYAMTSFHVFGAHVVDPWLGGYVLLSVVGHIKVRRHNEKVVAEQMRSRRRVASSDRRATAGSSELPVSFPDASSAQASPGGQAADLPSAGSLRRPATICPSCATPRDPLRFSCPQCAYFYDD